jgi:hypothetical protein
MIIIVIYLFLALFFMILPTISYTYHTKSALISVSYDVTHDIRAYSICSGVYAIYAMISLIRPSDISQSPLFAGQGAFPIVHAQC